MEQIHGRFHLVHVLATGAAGAGGADLQIRGVDLNLHRIGLRHHCHRGRGGVDPALGFGDRHPLHPVHSGFELEPAENAIALNRQDQLTETPQFRL